MIFLSKITNFVMLWGTVNLLSFSDRLAGDDIRMTNIDQIIAKLDKFDRKEGKIYEVELLEYRYLQENKISLNQVALVCQLISLLSIIFPILLFCLTSFR